ncbi:MAG TPA: cupin domain-containing protein [Orrella sp.]|nr:cupin domain-containing protein [Marinobacter sp.]
MTDKVVGQPSSGNLFESLPKQQAEEEFETLFNHPNVRIERIVSTGQCSGPGFWYDYPHAEWVLLMQGQAELQFENESSPTKLSAGDYICIDAHRRHRVVFTQADPTTVWLAVHLGA